jgi:hypothetical protein
MKTRMLAGSALALVIGLSACKNDEGRFLNLTSGEEVNLVRDGEGRMIDAETQEPVLLYVDTDEKDTFYGINGDKVNGRLYREDDDVYVYDAGEEYVTINGSDYKVKTGSYKEKREGDEYKFKSDDVTIKQEGGEYKVERDGYKKKVDEDGDVKIKTDDKKIKIDGETGERKVKERSVFGKLKDKVTDN